MNTQHWITQLDENSRQFSSAFQHLSNEALNWQAYPDTWSISQVIDHLITVNTSFHPTFKQLQAGTYQAPFIAKIGFIVRFLGRMILQSVQTTAKRKVKTFPVWEPSQSNIDAEVHSRFQSSQEEMKAWIKAAGPWLEKGVVIGSPASNKIAYRLEDAFNIIVTHQQRHFEQAIGILQMQSNS